MRIQVGALIVASAVIACGSSEAAPKRLPHRCGPARAKTLAVDRVARIYALSGHLYGCAVSSRHRYLLGSTSRSVRGHRVGPVALAGRVVAYGLVFSGVDTVSATVVVRSLEDGRQLHNDAATSRPVGAEFFEAVDRVVVKRDGAVAWTSSAGSIVSGHSSEIEVDRDDARGRALLDSGPGIAVDSLRLHGSTLKWRDGSSTRSANLR